MANSQQLSSLQYDALREIGNIGAGNAATALAKMINKRVDMKVPRVSMLPFSEVASMVGGAEEVVAGIYLRVSGPVPGNIVFLLPKENALYLVDLLFGRTPGETKTLSELEQSALLEIGNILTGAYLGALAMMTNMTLVPSVPALAIDMAGAVLSTPLTFLGEVGDVALLIETEFTDDGREVTGHFFLIPDPGALDRMLAALGVGG